jgi:glycosyltransferase involved in cell wall biosynthesis
MNILSVAFPLMPVGDDAGGGAEQILTMLEKRVVAQGHRSFVIAAEGSKISGELIPSPSINGQITDAVRSEAISVHRELIQDTLRKRSIDLVHFHGLDFYAYLPSTANGADMLATLHLPIDWYPPHIVDIPRLALNCVSQHQATSQSRPPLDFVINGVEVGHYNGNMRQREHLLFIGRICPEKGADIALRVAHSLDLPIAVAGPVHPYPTHQAYFAEKVQPHLDDKRRYVGPIGLREKIRLLAGAQALLIPSLVAETSSLVAMEAASAGTPVIAYRSGALPEVVVDGRTGFIVESEQQMAEAIRNTHLISAADCRTRARELFDADRMAAEYLQLYRRILAR